MQYFNLIEPLYLNIALNFNSDFNPTHKKNETFKYQVVVLQSKVILSVTPAMVKDLFQMNAYLEMQSYVKDLKRYRPTIRIKTMIDACRKNPNDQKLKDKKRAVIKGWF